MKNNTLSIGWMHTHTPAPGSERPYKPRQAPRWDVGTLLPGSALDSEPQSILGHLEQTEGDS